VSSQAVDRQAPNAEAWNAEALIDLLQASRTEVRVDQGELVVKAPRGVLTPGVIAALKLHKQALLTWAEALDGDARRDAAPRITPNMLPLVQLDAAQIERIASATPGGAANIQDIYPLAPLQEGMLFHHLLQQVGDAYLTRVLMAFESRALLDRFVAAMDEAIARHDMLRTAVHWDGLKEPVQVVWRRAKLDVQELRFDADVRAQLQAHADPQRIRLDVRRAPMMQGYAAYDSASQRWLLQLLYHHLAMDHISLEVVVEEVGEILLGRGAALPAPIAFRDFVARARLEHRDAEHDAFFRAMLADVESPTAPFELLDVQGSGADVVQAKRAVDAALAARIRRLARAHEVSAASLFHLAWAQVLARCSGRHDVVFGTVLFGRMQGGAGADRAVGMFINTLPVRVRVGARPARQALRDTHAALIELLDHEHASLTLAQRCSGLPAGAPLFSSLLNYRYSRPADHVDAERTVRGIEHLDSRDRTNYPFVLHVDDHGEGFTLTAEIVDRIAAPRIAGFAHRALEVLADALERAPETPMDDLEILSEAERELVLHGRNATARAPGDEVVVHALVERQAARTPDAIALEHAGEKVRYAELNERANQLAHHLRGLGVGPDDRVAVFLDRGVEMVEAILAILKAGGAYVPMDPAHPDERLAHMLADSAPRALITAEALRHRLDAPAGCARVVLDEVPRYDAAWRDAPTHDLDPGELGPSHLAYVIYTSGSTGQPKGVAMPHAPLVNLLRWQADALPGAARTLQFAALGFDVAFQEIFSTLATGGTLVLLGESLRQDLPALADWLAGQEIERLFLPYIALNALAELWAQQATPLPALRDLITAGEQLRITPAIRRLFDSPGEASLVDRVPRLHNHYGPTESHVVTAYTLSGPSAAWDDLPPIGTPIDNCRIYLLDAQRRPVPLGVTGEIWIGGVQVARGYLERPALTEERFCADPFVDGGRMYRTGDLGRWRDDGLAAEGQRGVIEYLGRNDFQVKIRGYRVELGEIETQLARLPGVREAAVIAREDVPGDRRLIAYVVAQPGAAIEPAFARAQLAATLPEHMLPTAFVALDALPLTPNGKLDRKALPAPDDQAFLLRAYKPTTGEIEDTLAQIWSELLRVERVGRDDNFFELGGHSLLAVRVVSQLRERLGIELPLAALFTHPHLADLAHDVAEAGQNTLSAIVRADRSAALPLSFAQQRLWFVARVDPEASRAYHLADAVRMRGPLDVAALRAALDRIVERHESLRTRFVGTSARQVIDAPRGFALTVEELGPVDEAALARICRDEAAASFDLAIGPLIRGRLLRLGADDHALLVTMHHIVSDGWSMGNLAREFSTLYDAFRAGRPDPLPPLAIQYADYGAWQRQWLSGPLLQQRLSQLVEHLRGAPALLDLPTDRPRPTIQDYRGANLEVELGAALSAELRLLCQRHGVTLYMALLAAWSAVLSRLSGQEQIVIGSSHAGRGRVEVEPLIGFFINTQALKVDLSGRPSVRALLQQARDTAVQAQNLQDVPFERLVEVLNPPRSLAYHPVFQVMLSWHNTPKAELSLPGLSARGIAGAPVGAQFELSLELREVDDGISGQFNYATALFDEASIRRHWGYLVAMLRAMVADDGQAVAAIDVLDDAERALVLDAFNDPHAGAAPAQPGALLHTRFEAQAAAQPDGPALVYEGESLSYGELEARANQLARHLRGLGVGPDARVAICAERSLEMVVAMFATLKAGGAFVPLDPVYPDDRLAHMLEDSGAVVVMTQAALAPRLAAPAACARVVLDAAAWSQSAWAAQPAQALDPAEVGVTGAHLAYVIYTSGSTGTPKGVMVEHRNVLTFLDGLEACIHGLHPQAQRIAWNSSFGFDMAVKAWGQLTRGRTVYLVPEAIRLDAGAMLAFLETHRIEAMECTPSHLRMMQGAGLLEGRARSLRKLLLGGEAIDAATWRAMVADDHTLFFNMYGPTECSVDASCGLIDGRRPHIGRVMPGARIYLLDEARRPVPVGVPGELWIGGAGVARGYLHRPALTAERFVDDPFAGRPGARMYRTGDLGRWRDDGTIEYLGRNDGQIKLRGFRIELGEIEARLAQLDGVRSAAVIVREDTPGDRRLVAYVVAAGEPRDPAQLRAALAQSLPEYMLPAAFVAIDALPLTPNGKLDRGALPAPEGHGLAQRAYAAPEGEIETLIAQIWSALLGVERVGRHDNFFDLGGYSLMLFQVIEQLKQHGYDAALQDVLLAQELSALAQRITVDRGQVDPQWVTIRRGGKRPPVIFIHEPSGEVLSYERLARHLDDEVGLYGLRADLASVTTDCDYQRLGAAYVRIIRRALPNGPYRLAGWSAGGVLAYEVARQLTLAGERVDFVGLIDSVHRGAADGGYYELELSDHKMMLIAFIEYYREKPDADAVAEIMAAPDLATAVEGARRRGLVSHAVEATELEARFAVFFDLRAGAHRYRAVPIDAPVHLFTAHAAEPEDPANGWGRVLGARLRVHPIGGDHWSLMMNPAHARRLGAAIDATLSSLDVAVPRPAPALHPSAVAIRGTAAQATRVFCIPGAGASTTSFVELCGSFRGDAALIGLEAAALIGTTGAPPSLEEAAGRYVEAIRQMQPHGPYHLMGHSFGGWIALEAARQLVAANAVVAPVVLIDSEPPRAEGHQAPHQAIHEYVRILELAAGAPLGIARDVLDRLDEPAQVELICARMKQVGLLPPGARVADVEPGIAMFRRQCAIRYRPKPPFGGLALLLRAMPDDLADRVDVEAWRQVEPGLCAIDIAGSDHLSILKSPHVEAVLQAIGRHWYLAS
jgi:amino acid adenylation domain-containing protein